MVFVETRTFTKRINELMSDDEYRALQESLINRPQTGDIIQGTGGLRKVRWTQDGRGKRRGVRVIYYWMAEQEQLCMLYVFPKSRQADLTSEQRKALKAIVERWSDGS